MPNQISTSLCCWSNQDTSYKVLLLSWQKPFSVLLFITSLLNAPNILSLDLMFHHLVLHHPSTHPSISSVNPSIYIFSTHSCWWTSAMLGISHCCHLQEKQGACKLRASYKNLTESYTARSTRSAYLLHDTGQQLTILYIIYMYIMLGCHCFRISLLFPLSHIFHFISRWIFFYLCILDFPVSLL